MMTPPVPLSLVGIAVVSGALAGAAVHAWHLYRQRRIGSTAAQAQAQPLPPTRYGADPSIAVADNLRRVCQDELLHHRDPLHERVMTRLYESADALDAHHGRGVALGDVDLGRVLAEAARGQNVALIAESPTPRVWADHLRLSRAVSWMIEEALRGGHGAAVEVEHLPGARVAVRVWPRRCIDAALALVGRQSTLPYLSSGDRFARERSWAEAQGGRLTARAVSGGDPVFVLELGVVVSMSSAALK